MLQLKGLLDFAGERH